VYPITVIGLGSNLGDRRKAIDKAILAIEAFPTVEVMRRSSLWRTAPVGGPPQPDFYNAAIAIRSPMLPEELMQRLLALELELGRVRSERNAPRIIDLDILWRGGPPIRIGGFGRPALEIPHPRLHERAFALVPLLEVAPDAADPNGKLYAAILSELGTAGVAPLDSSGS
jgi:2-amino-4-hydroxy-6-hydroxymethyldihydropteridine diphosphokinase